LEAVAYRRPLAARLTAAGFVTAPARPCRSDRDG
jgi:hypothetical protein